MQYATLGQSKLRVSKLCLGTMTWGEQNTEADAHAQLDMALDSGINFVDTAEMYPAPASEHTYGASERILGNWLKQHRGRDKIVLATKVVGHCQSWMPYIRDGGARLDRANILAAVDSSLQRLQTDYIDLYQVHWPERNTNYFGRLGYEYDPDADNGAPLEETLDALATCVRAGKVREIGVSNETPWGVMSYLRAAERANQPRIVSIQNPYSLVNRTFEIGLAEIAMREKVGLLAYSPLGFGILTAKYLAEARPPGARLTLFKQFKRYTGPRAEPAVRSYLEIARRHGLSLPQMAVAYVAGRPFVTSAIVGATSLKQLQENIGSIQIQLAEEVIRDIEKSHKNNPNPAP